jgi:hypothetical protein
MLFNPSIETEVIHQTLPQGGRVLHILRGISLAIQTGDRAVY